MMARCGLKEKQCWGVTGVQAACAAALPPPFHHDRHDVAPQVRSRPLDWPPMEPTP